MPVLDGRVAVVTGGARGIGRAIVERFTRDGAAVVFSYRRDEELARKVVADAGSIGGRVCAVRVDLTDLDDIVGLFDTAERAFGGVDVVVNNAGEGRVCPIAETTEEVYDRMMAVNAKGAFFVLQQAARRLRDEGAVITISSASTVMAEPGAAVYSASKAAVEQFTRAAALELAPRRITVNAVSPGATDTDMLRAGNSQEVLDAAVRMTPLGRLGLPSDIADVVAFLAGPDARWVTGQNLRVTGGLA
ncbi:3-oxoacyl-[acyl-carrier protein] reductase [Streptoalloteichus tenebrarius]|uniref:3-oxoacyl-[acyl-carrier protein] reductase n=1 Tax=Streptoalloteichus tenebrarius (strain ATCC 17920 / DSM 40477 / JCM 4838 / CBS 697.72 / NBRC 16177 / NCIMB 11028 / NRRL B-12390 / A12253. 1 / ISP 5477) TaxID=1933 RepID=A0ABT1HSL8_STRSD|nr:glucose 1-dehydrogenase [Streptoalloteichus tenebrarius]MCP2258524.1 3-oxoacyl-[acyl-carrier protein] reductase [Streptoalloteichus tenebrarius]BFF04113.1 SDR family oxidoreductase [Streptoalloteichus tenebrarius]